MMLPVMPRLLQALAATNDSAADRCDEHRPECLLFPRKAPMLFRLEQHDSGVLGAFLRLDMDRDKGIVDLLPQNPSDAIVDVVGG